VEESIYTAATVLGNSTDLPLPPLGKSDLLRESHDRGDADLPSRKLSDPRCVDQIWQYPCRIISGTRITIQEAPTPEALLLPHSSTLTLWLV
jgi:hypothetical protein